MNTPANVALLILAGVVAVGVPRYFWHSTRGAVAESAGYESGAIEGRVLSVDPLVAGVSLRSPPRYASVKLGTGETVRAIVGGCVVFPGQIARLAKHGAGSSASYVVTENGRYDS